MNKERFVLEVETDYPQRFTDDSELFVRDRQGFAVGRVVSIREGDIIDVGNDAIRELDRD